MVMPMEKQKRSTLTLVILIGINLLNYIDRYTISGILPLLQDKKDSGFSDDLSDAEAGLLMTAFIVSYMIFSPIFGYLGDRWSRKLLILVGILFWSVFTVGGSFSTSYYMLLGARALVGIGEASYVTVAPTIIADLYPAAIRTSVLSVFYLAIPVGSALGFIIGAEAASALGSWRWALRLSPPLGVALAVVLFIFTTDPPRGGADNEVSEEGLINTNHGLKAFLKDCKQVVHVSSFTWSTLGTTAVVFTTGALAQWAPTYLHRQSASGFSVNTASFIFGGVTVATGVGGTLLGAYLSKIYTPRTRTADGIICGMGLLGSVPFLAMALPLVAYSDYSALVLIFFAEMLLCLNWAPVNAILLYVIPPHQRSSAEALSILFQHLFGDAFSPYIVGVMSDSLQSSYNLTDGDALMFALLMTCAVAILGAAAFLYGSRFLPRDRYEASRKHGIDEHAVNSPIGEQAGDM